VADKNLRGENMGTSSVYAPVGFSGVSQYSNDFQSVMTRQQGIDAVPVTGLTNQNTDIASEDTSLTALNTAAAALTTDLSNIAQLSTGLALSASTTDATAVTATITGATSPASYSITNITSVASAASETSSAGYASAATSNVVSPTGNLQLQLIAGGQNLTLTLTPATNNLTGVAAAINSLDAGVTATVITTGSGSTDNYLSISENTPGATTLQLNALGGTATGSATAAGSAILATGTVLQVQGGGLTAPIDFAFSPGETVTTALADLQNTASGSGQLLAAAGITVSGAAGGKLAFTAASGSVSVTTSGDTTNSLGFGISTNTLLSGGSAGQSVTAASGPTAGGSNGQTFGISIGGGPAIDIGTGVITGADAAETGAAAAAGLNAAIAKNATLSAAGLAVTANATTGALTFATTLPTSTTGPAFSVEVTSQDGVTGAAGTSTDLGFGLGSAIAAGPVSGTNILTSANQGSDSKFDLNGIAVDNPNTAVSGVIPGVTLNILGSTTANETVGVTIATDPNAISSALTNLVTDYNTLALQVNAQIGPAAGLLSGSPIVYQLRAAMSSLVHYQGSGTGSITNIANLGIEVNGDGTLTLNPTTFASLSDSDIASALTFFGSSTASGLGSLQSTFSAVSDPVTGSIAGQLSADTALTTNLTAQIATMNAQIAVSEETLLTELEAADAQVADLQSEQSLLTSSISALQFTSYGYQSQQTAAG
jgi:flagellar hook-associated protein 2